MFKLANEKDRANINAFCSFFPLGVRISCQMDSYGFERDFLKIWLSKKENKINSVIASFDGSVTLCAEKTADFEEIKSFLCMLGYDSLCAEKSVFEKLGLNASSTKRLFKFCGEQTSFDEVKSDGDLKQVYSLISRSIPNSFPETEEAYLSFLSDFTFRQRRDHARLKTVCDGEMVLSCALTAAESDCAAMISGVACDASQRGKGIGKKTVLTLASELENENKDVYIIALNDSAGAFYEKLGFKEYETVCYS